MRVRYRMGSYRMFDCGSVTSPDQYRELERSLMASSRLATSRMLIESSVALFHRSASVTIRRFGYSAGSALEPRRPWKKTACAASTESTSTTRRTPTAIAESGNAGSTAFTSSLSRSRTMNECSCIFAVMVGSLSPGNMDSASATASTARDSRSSVTIRPCESVSRSSTA